MEPNPFSSMLSKRNFRFKLICFPFCLVMVFLAGCRTQTSPAAEEAQTEMSLELKSPMFNEGSTIPTSYTCDGNDISPQLDWSGKPENTLSLVLIADDPDAPLGTWVHWVLYDLPPDLNGLPEAVTEVGTSGTNSFKKLGFGGPCPPKGSEHRYYFKLYALDTLLLLEEGASKAEVEKAMQGHILAQGQLMGKYGR
jgi:Raf kinase inhibitor-like YbhB/YbcL family protein